jgi:hypothetical protein
VTTNQPTAEMVRSPTTEKRFAVAEVAAPIVTAGAMAFLDPHAAATVSCFLAAPAVLAGATASGLLPQDKLHALPGGDIVHAHKVPFLTSAIATGIAAATATMNGPAGIDTLLAGWMTLPTMAGLASVAWWGATGFVGYSLRRVLGSSRRATAGPIVQPTPTGPDTPAGTVLQRWHDYISSQNGVHPNQHLKLTAHGPHGWEGVIEAEPGRDVTVTAATISGVYRLPIHWISISDGHHGSSKHVLVHTTEPVVDQRTYSALEALWLKRVARRGGCMPGTHLEGAIPDPATGGVAAWIVADEDTDAITTPEPWQIAGALRTTTLLVSVEPTMNPRRAKLRIMDRSPLQDGQPLPSLETLRANKNGFVQLGPGISGRPARLQLFDPKIGAQHIIVAGVTGSGKGGVLQLICLSYHVNGVAIIYADPKGSSNPDVAKMAAHAGLGKDGAMGSLRLAYAILQHRIAESAATEAKNFQASAERPFIGVVLDEFAQLLGEKAEHKKEAAFIVAAIAEQGRSLGMAMVLCGQIMNLDKMGSDTSIRDNIFYGGALVLLRSDSDQKNRVDLPDSFAGIDPSKIPAFWKGDDEALIYDPTLPEDDPSRTFGVGYVVGPDERAEMMRAWILESAAGLYDPERIVVPADFPDWDDRDEIAVTPVGPAAEDDEGGDEWAPAPARPMAAKEPTAEEKILRALDGYADPLGQEALYLHIDQIEQMTGVARKTIENTVSRMVKAGALVRNPDRQGEYGLPLAELADAS